MNSRLASDLDALGAIGADNGGVTRLAWTDELRAGYAWLESRCREAGLDVELDAAGNLIARWDVGVGPAVLMGSHIDTVRQGGRYDGALGVLGGLEAIRLLKDRGVTPTRPVWLVAFMDEENTRFGTALFGSRAFAGELVEDLTERRDRDGISLAHAMRSWDRSPTELPSARGVDAVGAYLELHIEQGPQLEAAGADVGVVTAIVGIAGYRVRLTGETNHAGTTPMHLRRDALAGAARVVLGLHELARERPGTTTNVGVIGVEPGGSNVVPGVATFTLDLRAPTEEGLRELEAAARRLIDLTCDECGLEAELVETYRIAAAPMDDSLVDLVERCAALEEAATLRMPSGAGHDAMVMARHVPTAMVFVPSRGGISHSPDEFTDPGHCDLGARVLARVVKSLALGPSDGESLAM